MDYLAMVNAVLKRLREEEVTSLYENALSSVVSEFVKDAHEQIENAHNWSDLRTDIAIGTTDGTSTYSLTGSGNRATVNDVRDVTNGSWLTVQSSKWMRIKDTVSDVGTAKPIYYALDGTDSNGDTQIKLWPTPDQLYTIKVHVVQRGQELTEEGSTVSVPTKPIVLLATAMAAEDRGDVGAAGLQSMYGRAKRSLGDHIMLDAAHNPDEMIWYPV